MEKPVILVAFAHDEYLDCYGNSYHYAGYQEMMPVPCIGLIQYDKDDEPTICSLFADAESFKRFFIEQKELESFFDSITAM